MSMSRVLFSVAGIDRRFESKNEVEFNATAPRRAIGLSPTLQFDVFSLCACPRLEKIYGLDGKAVGVRRFLN